jgi:Domain of unknown function (DUF4157)
MRERSHAQMLKAGGLKFTPSSRSTLQGKCACGNYTMNGQCGECAQKRELLQRKMSGDFEGTEVPSLVHEVLRSPGQPLAAKTRAFMEPRFGHDFSGLRVHTDAKSVESARVVNALAYTVGRDIVFGSSHVASDTRQGRELIAHELAHVVQQSQNAAPRAPQSFGGDEHGPAETEADRVADRIIEGEPGGPVSAQPGPSLHRKVNVDKPKDFIANPTGKGLVQTNAQTVEGYLQTLCSGGTVSVNKGGGVSLAAAFCPTPMPAGFAGPPAPAPADKSKEPTGCNCLCDMVGSANDFTIVVDDKDWPHTSGRVVTTPSPNSPKLWGAATITGKKTTIDPWLVLGHELCGHAWLAEKGLPDDNATRGEGGHQETVGRENELRKEHGIEARGSFKDPYCGESFSQDKAGPGPVEWSSYLKTCEAWRKKTYGGKYKISDKIP